MEEKRLEDAENPVLKDYLRRYEERRAMLPVKDEPEPRRKPRLPRVGDGVNFDGAVYRVMRVKKDKILLKYWRDL